MPTDAPRPLSGRALVVSSAAAARLERARTFLSDWVATGREVRVVAASRGAADDLVRSLPGGALGVHRSSLAQLAHELAAPALARTGCAPLGTLGSLALATRVASECAPLSFLLPISDLPGFPVALERTLRELRLAGVAPAALGRAAGPSAPDLARLLARAEVVLGEAALADYSAVLAAATGELARGTSDVVRLPSSESGSHNHQPPTTNRVGGGASLLLLDVGLRSQVEETFVAALVKGADAVLATLPLGDDESVAALSRALGVEAERLPDAEPGRLGRLRRRLFVEDAAGEREAPAPDDGAVELVSAAGEARECAEIALRVRELAASGAPFDDIAVALRDQAWLGLVAEAFARADIPFVATREARQPDPAGRAFLALLACADEGLSASRFAEYLSLGQVPRADADGAPPLREVAWVEPAGAQLALATPVTPPADAGGALATEDAENDPVIAGGLRAPRAWERLLVDAAVIGGHDRWRRRLTGLEGELDLRLSAPEVDEPRREALLARRAALRRLEAFALPLVDQLATLPGGAVWGDWLEHLGRLAARALRDPSGVQAVLGELAPMAAVGPVSLGEVLRVLQPRLSFLQRDPEGPRYGRVFVGGVEDLRGRSFRVVFVPGLAEGVFPRRALEDPLLLDAARASLDVGLPIAAERVARERLLLRLAVGAARERLVVSWPRHDLRQGRARTPSFYALDVARAATGDLAPLDVLQSGAAQAAAARQGWPAPRDPRRALDDGEFDLAVVAELRRPRAPGEPPFERGAGNYLLQVEPALARALIARGWRWHRELSDVDGLVAQPTTSRRERDPGALALLEAQRPRARPYSPTALQHYSACPYRFLLQAIHRLRPREEAEAIEALDPLTRGGLFHQIQFLTLKRLRAAGEIPLGPGRVDEYLVILDQVVDHVAGEARERLAPAIPRVWESEIEELRIDLRGWLRLLATTEASYSPRHFELAFGLPDEEEQRDAASTPEPAEIPGGFRLRGSIDLVEDDGRLLRVTDHKTGRPAAKAGAVVGGGALLQPVLYSLAAEALLDRRVASGRLWYCTRKGGYEVYEVALDERARDAGREVLEIVERAVAGGFLPALPVADACTWCDYRLVCGPDEERRARVKRPRQRPAELDDLVELRKMP